MEPLITFARENYTILIVASIVLVPIGIIYQKKVAPVIFHAIEYMLYCTIAHCVIYVVVKIIAWYKSQTPDLNSAVNPFNTPLNPLTSNYFDMAEYNPSGLFYFELLVWAFLLYVVLVMRPTSYKIQNQYSGDKERGMHEDGKPRTRQRYNRTNATKQRGRK